MASLLASFCSSERTDCFKRISRSSSLLASFKRSSSSRSTKDKFSFVLSSLILLWVVCNSELSDSISDFASFTFSAVLSNAFFAYFSALYTLSAILPISTPRAVTTTKNAVNGFALITALSFAHATVSNSVMPKFAPLATVSVVVAAVSASSAVISPAFIRIAFLSCSLTLYVDSARIAFSLPNFLQIPDIPSNLSDENPTVFVNSLNAAIDSATLNVSRSVWQIKNKW